MKNIYFCIYLLTSSLLMAQVGINTQTPHASAALDILSSNKGVSFPKISLATYNDVSTINVPTESLLIYNTNPSLVGKQG